MDVSGFFFDADRDAEEEKKHKLIYSRCVQTYLGVLEFAQDCRERLYGTRRYKK